MKANIIVLFSAVVLSSSLLTSICHAQIEPQSGLFPINSGRYITCCGFGGSVVQNLPHTSQRFIQITVNPTNHSATMSILGDNLLPLSVFGCPPASPFSFTFTNGTIQSNRIQFSVFGVGSWSGVYTAEFFQASVRLNGRVFQPFPGPCSDLPTQFSHTNVVAQLPEFPPVATVRVSEVEVCWNTRSNSNYQVQYRSALDTNGWINLGTPVAGSGATNCIKDPVPPGEPRRYYQVVVVP